MNVPNRILVRGLELIESGWTRAAYARDATGRPTTFDSPLACQWCSDGGRNRASWELKAGPWDDQAASGSLSLAMGGNVVGFNDSRTKAEVVAAFKVAIEATK